MLKTLSRYLWLILLFPAITFAADATPTIVAGKNYQVVPVVAGMPMPPKGKIEVVEFFSYGCPACNHFEPDLEAWLAKKPNDVVFERIPVTFESGWDILARAYYTAKALGVAEKLSPAIFTAIQSQGMDLTNPDILAQFFVSHGVSKKDFDSTYNFSPGIDAQVMRGDNLMRAYGIYQVPTVVVDGKFVTNPVIAGGDSKGMLQVIDYLIAQERAAMKKPSGK